MRLILVGGFLGAGKTTLLRETARRLAARHERVGLITNDQAPELVDTAWLSTSGAGVREVAGSCFCCDFAGFQDAITSLEETGADCVVGEPVGSCTDLSATILQPLKEHFPQWRVAPLSVLVEPARLRGVLRETRPRLHADAAYILRLQLAEADRILLSKADTLSPDERDEMTSYLESEFPHAPVNAISAATGEGIDAWLEAVVADGAAGSRIVDVDYDRYAHGEAVLGWLNAVLSLRWTGSLEADWQGFLEGLFAALHERLKAGALEVGHIKMLLDDGRGKLIGNLTGLHEQPGLRREGSPERLSAMLTVNARVQAAPQALEAIVREAVKEAAYGRVAATYRAMHCLSPGRPVPTYRYGAVVE
jgi:Ni2+-binding GTPase involved in maturation of urease and hydrogenase